MALEKFHYTFKDGKKITTRKFTDMSFKTFRKIQAEKDDEERGMIMMDALFDGCDAKSKKILEEQPFTEVVGDLLEAWGNEAQPDEVDAVSPED